MTHERSPQIVNSYGDSELIRRIIFNTAGSFGFPFVPLNRSVSNLVHLFLIRLVRISGFSSHFSAIAVFVAPSGKMC